MAGNRVLIKGWWLFADSGARVYKSFLKAHLAFSINNIDHLMSS